MTRRERLLSGTPNYNAYTKWIVAAKSSRVLKNSTLTTYGNDVARWIVYLDGYSVQKVKAERIARFLKTVKTSQRGRVLSAISDFWAFAMSQGWVDRDEPRLLKFRRSKHAIEAQLDFFELLTMDGLSKSQILAVRWGDFLQPMIAMQSGVIKSGKRTIPIPTSWSVLAMEFRCLASQGDLSKIIEDLIIPVDDTRRVA